MFNKEYHRKIDLLVEASKRAIKDPGYLNRHHERLEKDFYDCREDERDYLDVRKKIYFELLKG